MHVSLVVVKHIIKSLCKVINNVIDKHKSTLIWGIRYIFSCVCEKAYNVSVKNPLSP